MTEVWRRDGRVTHIGPWPEARIDAAGNVIQPSPAKEGAVTTDEPVVRADDGALVPASEYRDLRRRAYPRVQDQLDMIFRDQRSGTTEFSDTIQAVKDRYPQT